RGRSRAAGGTGLGLAITKHIAMRHDADLLIDSELGKGSTFTLRFPAERVTGEDPDR
ncbi:ATP-binding protein, partial [Bordetella pertussis]